MGVTVKGVSGSGQSARPKEKNTVDTNVEFERQLARERNIRFDNHRKVLLAMYETMKHPAFDKTADVVMFFIMCWIYEASNNARNVSIPSQHITFGEHSPVTVTAVFVIRLLQLVRCCIPQSVGGVC